MITKNVSWLWSFQTAWQLCIPTTNKTPVSSDNVLLYVTYLNQAWKHTNPWFCYMCTTWNKFIYHQLTATILRQVFLCFSTSGSLCATMSEISFCILLLWYKYKMIKNNVNIKVSKEATIITCYPLMSSGYNMSLCMTWVIWVAAVISVLFY